MKKLFISMKMKNKKIIIIFSIVIAIFTTGLVYKTFQNDTFFNIAIGKDILTNGIDMKEHFCWVNDNLDYSYSHWAFDVIIYLIYNSFNFKGIYIFTIILSIITNVTLFTLLSKRTKSPIISFIITLITAYINRFSFTARSQIVSFLCFIAEIYCIEEFIETNKKRYAIAILIQSLIIANFHAATWPLVLVLFMPYVATGCINLISAKNLYKHAIKKLNKKIQKLPKLPKYSSKLELYKKDIEDYERLLKSPPCEFANYKSIRKENYNLKNLIILMIIISLSGLITPIQGTPYTYILKSMFGQSNFEYNSSIDFINEMKPLVPVTNLSFVVFSILFIGFLAFVPSKLKTEHGFLVLGLSIMALVSVRYSYLLAFLGSYALADIITYAANLLIKDDIKTLENFAQKPFCIIILLFFSILITTNNLLDQRDFDYIDKAEYPIEAVKYIKNNLEYEKIRIFNSYNNGSYLMLNNIPVFIDSRLDVYCSEFNDTDIFYDFIKVSKGELHYEEIFTKYDFTHILIQTNSTIYNYLSKDSNYNLLHEDENYVLYERILAN